MLLKPKCNSDPFKTVEEWMSWKKIFYIVAQVWLLLPLIAWGYKYYT